MNIRILPSAEVWNEGTSLFLQVRIGDVINSEDVNIYRQLAGVT